MATQMEGVLKEMATFYDEMATFQADAMVGVCPVFLQHSKVFQINVKNNPSKMSTCYASCDFRSSSKKCRCDLKKLKAKTVEITKKDVALNNLIQRAKPIMHV